jgi:DNA-binding MarR family transcriptional regulator
VFDRVRRVQAFEKEHFPHLQSRVDSVLIAEVGYHQEQGRPLTAKGLLSLGMAPPATVRRRLQRLVRLGLVRKRPVAHDGRIYYLEVDAALRQTYARYLKLMSRL